MELWSYRVSKVVNSSIPVRQISCFPAWFLLAAAILNLARSKIWYAEKIDLEKSFPTNPSMTYFGFFKAEIIAVNLRKNEKTWFFLCSWPEWWGWPNIWKETNDNKRLLEKIRKLLFSEASKNLFSKNDLFAQRSKSEAKKRKQNYNLARKFFLEIVLHLGEGTAAGY